MPALPSQIVALTLEEVPLAVRPWVERVLILPLNRTLDLLRSVLNRGVTLQAHVNCQVFEKVFTVPAGSDWSASRLDTPSTLTKAAIGLQVLAAYTVDSTNHDSAPIGTLGLPKWREIVQEGKRFFRIIHQDGVTAGTRVRLLYVAWGGL